MEFKLEPLARVLQREKDFAYPTPMKILLADGIGLIFPRFARSPYRFLRHKTQ